MEGTSFKEVTKARTPIQKPSGGEEILMNPRLIILGDKVESLQFFSFNLVLGIIGVLSDIADMESMIIRGESRECVS